MARRLSAQLTMPKTRVAIGNGEPAFFCLMDFLIERIPNIEALRTRRMIDARKINPSTAPT